MTGFTRYPRKRGARDVLVQCQGCRATTTGRMRGKRLSDLRGMRTDEDGRHWGCGGPLVGFDIAEVVPPATALDHLRRRKAVARPEESR